MNLDLSQFTQRPVSRETYSALDAYVALIEKWNPHINLIAAGSIADIWPRHIADSAQILPLIPEFAQNVVDLGSGGGLPAIVIAILFKEGSPRTRVTLIESDKRKATFLRQAIRTLHLNASVIADRIEAATSQAGDVVTARALAPLVDLIPLARRHLAPEGTAIFLKGERADKEIDVAGRAYSFDLEAFESKTGPGSILRLRKLQDV